MYFGADYYPEHWEESRWEPDLLEMKNHGFNMVRVAEFAWSRLEPRDSVYDFDWLDRFIALCDKHGFDVMMGLPVRVVPAWLFAKDPGMAILAADGTRESFGTRYTTCLSSAILREAALKLTRRMAERYRDTKRVVIWHLDNEYGDASTCYCDNCRRSFIDWLRKKYGSLDKLNREWGLAFWSEELFDWGQVWLPKKTNHFQIHPSLLQDYARFTSWKTEEIASAQCNILRELTPDMTITTNIQSITRDHTDYTKLCAPLDVASTNYYPPKMYNTVDLDRTRGLLRKNFWVVEQKSGAPGSKTYSMYTSPPGMTRLYTYQSIAHGADMILYYRWRSSYFGNEQFYMGIRSYDGGDNRISREIRETAKELPAVMKELEGTTVENDVALIFSQDSRWAMRSYKPNAGMEYHQIFLTHHRALERRHISTDIISPYDDLSKYKVVILPILYLADDAVVENIRAYVAGGGHIIATTRCAAKDEYARMVQTILPEVFSELFGIRIEEVLALEAAEAITTIGGDIYEIAQWAELLEPLTAETLARYSSGWFRGAAAMTQNTYGKGIATYLGTLPSDSFYLDDLAGLLLASGVQPCANGAAEIQATQRTDGTATFTFLLNPTEQAAFVTPRLGGTDLLTGRQISGETKLEPHEVIIVKS